MDRERMLKRLNAGYDPIAISKEKWEDIKRYGNGKLNGSRADSRNNCALCETYWNKDGALTCGKCPLYQLRNNGCYDLVYEYNNTNDPQPMLDALDKAKEWQEKEKCKEIEKEKQEGGITYLVCIPFSGKDSAISESKDIIYGSHVLRITDQQFKEWKEKYKIEEV